MNHTVQIPSPVGTLTLAGNGEAVVGLWIEGQKYWGETRDADCAETPADPVLCAAKKWLEAYFAGKRPAIADLPLAPVGSAFRQTVWAILREIPYGQVTTYGEVAAETARRLGKARMSARAAGGAIGHNRISIIIPCHRVVGANGSITGYAGGVNTKIALLRHEGVDPSRFFAPAKETTP